MTESRIPAVRQIGATLWAREVTPLRRFLRTETGSAAFLLGATVVALVWVNIDAAVVRVRSGRTSCRSTSATSACPRTCAAGSTPA